MSGGATPAKLPRERTFGLFFAAVFVAMAVMQLRHGRTVVAIALGVAAVVSAALALAKPAWLAPFNRAWYRLGLLLGRIVNPVVMTVLFYLVVTPYALLLRATGRDSLRLRLDPAAPSYWIARQPPGPEAGSLPRQF